MADARDVPGGTSKEVLDAIGGPAGMAEAAAPAIAYVTVYSLSGQDARLSAIVAVAIAGALTVWRLALRQSPRQALSGLVGVAFAAWIAARSGKAENFFLPGLIANAGYAAAFLVSILIRRPLVGVIVGQLWGGGAGWRDDPQRLRAFTLASWLWVVVFAVRLAVQLPLYLAGAVVALGVARTAMGLPLFALALWGTYRLVRDDAVAVDAER